MSTLFIVPWRRRADPVGHDLRERAEAHVGDALAHLDVARADRGRRPRRRRPCPAGATTCTGRSAPPLAGIVGSVHRPQRERDRADGRPPRPRSRCPAAAASVPVKSNVDAVAVDRRPSTTIRVGGCCSRRGPGRVEHVVEAPRAVGQGGERGAHPPLAVVDDLVERLRRRRAASESAWRTPIAVGAHLGVEVAARARRRARLARRAAPRTSVVEAHRRDAQALLRRSRSRRAASSPGAVPPRSAWWARFATQPTSAPSTKHRRDERDVVEVGAAGERVVEDDLVAGRDRRRRRARSPRATEAGIEPRCTGMCSACASSSPSAVNSAAEQSARSLMFGLNAARRSTAPISSATPVRREIRICSAAGSSVTAPLRASAPARRAGRASAPQPVGHPDRAVGSATTAGPRRAARSGAGRSVDGERRGPTERGARSATTSTGASRPRVAVAARVLGREVVDRRHRELVALPGVAAVDARSSTSPPGPTRRRRVARQRRRAPRRARRGRRGRRPRPHELALSRRREEPDRREHAGPRRDDHRAHAERVGERAGVQRSGAAERDQRELARVDARARP